MDLTECGHAGVFGVTQDGDHLTGFSASSTRATWAGVSISDRVEKFMLKPSGVLWS